MAIGANSPAGKPRFWLQIMALHHGERDVISIFSATSSLAL
jgi:hypothetical protein